ncbi:N-formylglutamate amidohydrolase [Alphaproteobacteria bacterium]|nr:N-formylglutamate amidohydrolase [Alphaproteobacteria bacterium]
MNDSCPNKLPDSEQLDAVLLSDADIPAPHILGGTGRLGPVIFSVPHSGRHYSTNYFTEVNLDMARSLEDTGTDVIARPLASENRPVLIAECCRALCDLNRPETALDPLLIEKIAPSSDKIFGAHITAGYGVIPRLSASKMPLHNRQFSSTEAETILEKFYRPFHHKLNELLATAQRTHSHIILMDIHSMPAKQAHISGLVPDVIFGNLYGATLPERLVETVDKIMTTSRYQWRWNNPYAGGYITRHYGLPEASSTSRTPAKGTSSVMQVEINRGLYVAPPFGVHSHKISELTSLLGRIATALELALSHSE